MRRLAALALALALALVALAAAAPAGARTTVIADGDGATGLTAYGGHLVWSQRDPATRRWRLMHWRAGRVTRLAVRSRAVPFDADAGSDAAGRPVLAFSRCDRDPRFEDDWLRARGCHLESLRLDVRGRPERVVGTDAPGRSATTPSFWNGGLAFVRHADGFFSSQVHLLRAGAAEPLALPGGEDFCEIDCDDRRIETTVESLDLGARAASFVWRQDGGDEIGIGAARQLRVDPLDGGKPALLSLGFVDGACGYVFPFAPTTAGLGVFWVAAGSECSDTETDFARADPSRRLRRVAPAPGGLIFGATRDGATTYWLRASRRVKDRSPGALACLGAKAACRIVRSTTLPYRTLRPGQQLGPYPEESR